MNTKSLLLTAALGLGSITLNASPLYTHNDETFSAGNISGQNGWTGHSGTGTPVQVAANGDVTLNHGSGSREDVNVGVTPISAGETYFFGFDVVVSGGNSDVYFAHFKDSANDFTTRLFVTSSTGSDFTFGLSSEFSTPDVKWATGLDFDTTYRVVGSYDADTNENRIWVNPTSIASPSITTTDSATNAVSAFAFRQASGNSSQVISNLTVSNDFASAIPEPSVTAFLLIGMGFLFRTMRKKK